MWGVPSDRFDVKPVSLVALFYNVQCLQKFIKLMVVDGTVGFNG